MTRVFGSLAVLTVILPLATLGDADIYRTTGEQGEVIYSDVPEMQSQRVKLEKPNVAEPTAYRPSPEKPATDTPKDYSVSITSPSDGQTFPNRLVPFTVESEVDPSLPSGYILQLKVDDRVHNSGTGNFTLSSLGIGPHTLQVDVLNQRGAVVSSSEPITIFTRQPGSGTDN